MFSKEVTNSSDFQMMSHSAQALYFHIGMNADDDGFCEVFTIVRMTESKPDDLRALQERGFIYIVDSRVCIVKDWHTNNDIRVDRYTKSKYLEDPKYGGVYLTIMEDKIKHLARYQIALPSGSTDGSTDGTTQVRLGKVRLGKDRKKYGQFQNVQLSDSEYKNVVQALNESGANALIDELDCYIESTGKRYKSHYATLQNWARRRMREHGEKLLSKKPKII
jgi:hypothetical protein